MLRTQFWSYKARPKGTRTTRPYRNITSSKAPGLTFGPALAWHCFILCVHTFCSLEEFTITALVESQHTSSSYTIDNSPSYFQHSAREALRAPCSSHSSASWVQNALESRIWTQEGKYLPDLLRGPSWQSLGLWSFTSSASRQQVGDWFHVQQRHNRYLGEHQWGKKSNWFHF